MEIEVTNLMVIRSRGSSVWGMKSIPRNSTDHTLYIFGTLLQNFSKRDFAMCTLTCESSDEIMDTSFYNLSYSYILIFTSHENRYTPAVSFQWFWFLCPSCFSQCLLSMFGNRLQSSSSHDGFYGLACHWKRSINNYFALVCFHASFLCPGHGVRTYIYFVPQVQCSMKGTGDVRKLDTRAKMRRYFP